MNNLHRGRTAATVAMRDRLATVAYPRFTRVDEVELTAAMLESRSDAQRRITAAKAKCRQRLR